MSTVVYCVEFIMVSLLGIMLYKLYVSYSSWNKASGWEKVPASHNLTKNEVRISISIPEKNALSKQADYLSASRIAVTESDLAETPVETKKSSTILNDYIGEFFSQPDMLDLEPFRANESCSDSLSQSQPSTLKEVLIEKIASPSNEQVDDEIISITSLHSNNHGHTSSAIKESSPLSEDAIPTLRELSDSDSYITVASMDDEVESNNKVMSDKVVLAMLDEAKLVCAS